VKIINLQAENIKKLSAVEITPAGALVQITGPNGSGKTSVLDSIYWALAGAKEIASQPVRKGEEKASIRLDLGEVVVTRRFTAAGGTTLTVEGAKGARFPSPQKMLDDLLGSLTFDPLAFSRMEPKKQLEQLRTMVKLDVDIDELDAQNAIDYAARTEVNRTAKQLEAQEAAIVVAPNLPDEPIDVSALLAEMEIAAEHNTGIEQRKQRRADVANNILSLKTSLPVEEQMLANLERQVAEQRNAIEGYRAKIIELQGKLDAAEPLPDPIDPAEIRAKIEAAQTTNEQLKLVEQREALRFKLEAAESQSAGLTIAIEERTRKRQDTIAKAAMPVPGLSFGDGHVIYNDIPFDQASSAEQLRVSVAIAMAMNPKLRVLRIKDGSLLDENGLKMIEEMAGAGDYQVWIERVDTSGTVGIVMEDGHIRAVEQVA
jgi:predicted ABC-type transport system involved in lysophospholipase L1 biosynthesis ATPase subunit